MNIFYISNNPVQATEWMVNRHIVSQTKESAQLLSTAHRVLDGKEVVGKSKTGRSVKRWVLPDARENVLYSATHVNHPSAVWCRQSVMNYNWLADHLFALLAEYTYRYGKTHKIEGEISYMLQSPPLNLKEYDMTTMPSAMDKKYIISDDPVVNYRNYYKHGKTHLHVWKKRNPPEWIND